MARRRKPSYTVTRRHNKDGSVTTTHRTGRTDIFGIRHVDVYTTKQSPHQTQNKPITNLKGKGITAIIIGIIAFIFRWWFMGFISITSGVVMLIASLSEQHQKKVSTPNGKYITAKAMSSAKNAGPLFVWGFLFAAFGGLMGGFIIFASVDAMAVSLPLWIISFIVGVIMIVKAIKKPDPAKLARKYNKVFESYSENIVETSEISRAMNKSVDEIENETRWLKNNGFMQNFTNLDTLHKIALNNGSRGHSNNRVVPDSNSQRSLVSSSRDTNLNNQQDQTSTNTVVDSCLCPYCGASINFTSRASFAKCEYCGMTIRR